MELEEERQSASENEGSGAEDTEVPSCGPWPQTTAMRPHDIPLGLRHRATKAQLEHRGSVSPEMLLQGAMEVCGIEVIFLTPQWYTAKCFSEFQ